MRVHLLRHGEVETPGHLNGRSDVPLSRAGVASALGQCAALEDWTRLVTSPLQRCRKTADNAAILRDVVALVDPDWREIDFGAWDGRAMADIHASDGARYAAFADDPTETDPPGGETWAQFRARLEQALRHLVSQNETTLVITHAGVIRAALHIACGLPLRALWALRIAPASVVTIEIGRVDDALWGELIELRQP